jgi:FMN phosphatase YigB (HAD superfamily)
MDKLGARPEECVFVGDDPRWDIAGPRAIGIEAVLIDRTGKMQDSGEAAIRDLRELLDLLDR